MNEPSSWPKDEAEWFTAGLIYGWQHVGVTPEAPAPLDEPYLQAYFDGCAQGAKARTDSQNTDDEGPSIGPDLGGQSVEEFDAEGREILEEIFHQHVPHTELPKFDSFYEPFGGMVQEPPPPVL